MSVVRPCAIFCEADAALLCSIVCAILCARVTFRPRPAPDRSASKWTDVQLVLDMVLAQCLMSLRIGMAARYSVRSALSVRVAVISDA